MTVPVHIRISATLATFVPDGSDLDGLVAATISEALTVTAMDAHTERLRRQYFNPLIGVSCLYRADIRSFPTGLLGHVVARLREQGFEPVYEWAASALPLPVAEDVSQATSKDGYRPRDYQLALVAEAAAKGRGIVQAATSSGKTAVMGLLLRALGNPPTLILVGSRTLVAQTRAEVAAWLGQPVGEFTAKRRVVGPNVVVGLVQSIAAASGDPAVAEFLRGRRVLLLDEAHRCARSGRRKAPGTGKITSGQWYGVAMRCVNAGNRYGFSATPLKIGDPLQNFCLIGVTGPLFEHGITATELISKGFAARPYVYWAPYKPPKIPRRGVLYPEVVRLGIVECIERNEAVTSSAQDLYDEGLKVLVLVEHTAHGRIIESTLRARGVPTMFIHGALTLEQQEDGLTWLREDGPRVCVSTRVLGEGTNVPSIGAVVYAKGGKAFVSLFQGIGRGLRPKGAPGAAGVCFVVIPDDTAGHKLLAKHAEMLRAYLSAEPGYRVALPGQPLRLFVRAVLDAEASA